MNTGKKRPQVLPPKTASKIPKPSTSVRKTPSTTLAADKLEVSDWEPSKKSSDAVNNNM